MFEQVSSEEQHRLVRQALPPAQIVDFPGCGHHIEAASPDAFVATVQGFLETQAQSSNSGPGGISSNRLPGEVA